MGLLDELREIVGPRHILTDAEKTRAFATGYRFGGGPVVAVVRPGSLIEQWRILQACVRADVVIILQAANTGLTGGSTPNGEYDRDVVIVSTTRITGCHLLDEGRQVLCLPGTTLFELERRLAPLSREPHSVIGSSCIGASVIGGVCNNSGGSLVRRGPVYTEYALYARVEADGTVRLCNRLGIDLGDDPETILRTVEHGTFRPEQVRHDGLAASDTRYARHVRDVDADTPARFNADPSRLFEASGSAGRIMLFAVRLDSFAKDERTATFYAGTGDTADLTLLRRRLLTELRSLPISGEYMHRDAFDIAERYGKDVFLAIRYLGTDRLPKLFAAKAWLDRLARRTPLLPNALSDHVMQMASRLFPRHLPRRMIDFRNAYEHHLILKVGGEEIEQTRAMLTALFRDGQGGWFQCTEKEAEAAFLHRFAVAGAAVRYRAVHPETVEDIVALDIAIRRNDSDWCERLPGSVAAPVIKALYYGHFLCHVFHQDYIVKKGCDPEAFEHQMWKILDERGAEYPAEHNVGHLYPAKDALTAHYRDLDPGNRLNPGIGHTSRAKDWR